MYSCIGGEYKMETIKKVVVSKDEQHRSYMVALSDTTSIAVDYGIYTMVNIGDTLVFECIEDFVFSRWNCSCVDIRRGEDGNNVEI